MAKTKDKSTIDPPPQPIDGPITQPEIKTLPPDPLPPPVVLNPSQSNPDPSIINTATPVASNRFTMTAGRSGDTEPYIFGRCIADPILVGADDRGYFLYTDLLWSVGEIDYLETLYVDGEPVGRNDQLGKAEHFSGTAGQAKSTIMVGLKGDYDAMPNKAHSVVFQTIGYGLDTKALIRGLKVYDPRTTTTIYSTNPALALGRVLTDSGYTVNEAQLIIAANYCDEQIGAPAVNRWEIGGQIRIRRDLESWVHTLASYCSCFIDQQDGEILLIPDAPRAANHTVLADDMLEDSVRVYYAGGRDVPDSVTVTGKTVDGEVITYTYGTSGGAGTETTLNMPFFQRGDLIGRKAEEVYKKAQMNKTLEYVGFDDGVLRTLGDVGTVTNAQFGISGQTFALVEQKQLSGGRWWKKYRQYGSNYSDVIYEVVPIDTDIYNPYHPPAGPTPEAEEEIITTGGVTTSRFKITFTGIIWAYLLNYRVTAVSMDTGTTVLVTDVDPLGAVTHTTYTTEPLVSGNTYLISVFIRSNVNSLGAPGTTTAICTIGTNAELYSGELTNMHLYTLDGDGIYCTTSEKTGSPQTGQTWADRFTSSPLGAWTAGETWLGNQVCETTFQTTIWDAGQEWTGAWQFVDLNFSQLGGATQANFVRLSADTSPQSFSDNSGLSYSTTARFMIAKATVLDSPLSAGDGLHVKLPISVTVGVGA